MKNPEKSKRVLICEDSRLIQRLLKEMLDQIGLQSDIVDNGEDAIQSFCNHHYDLIMMDCQLPGMDGYEVTRMIRKIETEGESQIPIIAVTAVTIESHVDCLAAGMNDFLPKPFSQIELQERIDRWLGESDVGDLQQGINEKTDLSGSTADKKSVEERLDLHRLEELTCNDPEIMAIIIRDYQGKSMNLMTRLLQATKAGNLQEVRQIAHLFRPINDYIGATKMVRLLKSIESAAKVENLKSIQESMDQLTREHAQVIKQVSKLGNASV